MINFFRKTRLQLMTENKFSKYLIYAIGEIALVVIGILIALQINNWNEENKLNASKQVYYQQLLKDLNADKAYVSGKIEMYSDRISRYDTYLKSFNKPNLSPEEVIQNILKLDFTVDHSRFQNNTIVSLENTGDIKLIPIDIINRLMDLKRRQDLLLEFTKSNYDYYMDIIRPGGLTMGVWDLPSRLQNQPELTKLLKIDEKMDITIMSFDYAHFIKSYSERILIQDLKNMLADVETIIELINSNIEN
jgi:hypothetical protein